MEGVVDGDGGGVSGGDGVEVSVVMVVGGGCSGW